MPEITGRAAQAIYEQATNDIHNYLHTAYMRRRNSELQRVEIFVSDNVTKKGRLSKKSVSQLCKMLVKLQASE